MSSLSRRFGITERELPKRFVSRVMAQNVFDALIDLFRRCRRRHHVGLVETIRNHRTRASETVSGQRYGPKRVADSAGTKYYILIQKYITTVSRLCTLGCFKDDRDKFGWHREVSEELPRPPAQLWCRGREAPAEGFRGLGTVGRGLPKTFGGRFAPAKPPPQEAWEAPRTLPFQVCPNHP